MNRTLVVFALLFSVGLAAMAIMACAREGLPPGGPRDTFPPYVVESDPPPGSTHVPVDVTPTLTFNERIEPRSIAGNLFIAPIVEFDAVTNWRGNQVSIRFEEAIQGDRTYIITVGTGIRDLRGNRMDSTYVYALSTGSNIDQGEVGGTAIYDGRPARGAYIWAYSLTEKSEPDPATTAPDYLTQAGTDGTFSFTHLSADRYRFFAFMDQGRDRLYDAGTDPLGVPTRDVILSEDEMGGRPMWFRLAVNDTASMHVVSARPVHNRALNVLMSETPSGGQVHATGSFAIRGVEDGETLEVTAAYRDLSDSDSTSIVLITAPQTTGKVYSLTVSGLENKWADPVDATRNTADFTGSSNEDTTPPRLVEVLPDDRSTGIAQDADVRMTFSEPVSLEEHAVVLRDSTGRDVDAELRWITPTVAALHPDTLLWPMAEYGIRMLSGLVKDGSGQSLQTADDRSDTLDYAFSTIDPADYGSLSGRLEDESTAREGSVEISLSRERETGAVAKFDLAGPGVFRFENVLPGRYILQAYRDANANGRYDFGTAMPFMPAERSIVHPDTLEVRSGWETEDVTIRLGP